MTDTAYRAVRITHRTGVVKGWQGSKNRLIFGLLSPRGTVIGVQDATDTDDAWIILSGWEDENGIAERKARGFRVVPLMVEWSE